MQPSGSGTVCLSLRSWVVTNSSKAGWAGRAGISAHNHGSPRAQSPPACSSPSSGVIEQYQPHPGIPAAASPTHGCKLVVWNSASDWETTASQTDLLPHSTWGLAWKRPWQKRSSETHCVPGSFSYTQGHREQQTLPSGAHSQARETHLSRGFGRSSRPSFIFHPLNLELSTVMLPLELGFLKAWAL